MKLKELLELKVIKCDLKVDSYVNGKYNGFAIIKEINKNEFASVELAERDNTKKLNDIIKNFGDQEVIDIDTLEKHNIIWIKVEK